MESTSAPSVSLERGPPITYLERNKRKRAISNQPESSSMSPTKPAPTSKKAPSSSKAPQRIDAHELPPPSPKRSRRNSDESVKSAKSVRKGKKNTHTKASISSFNQVLQQVASSPSASKIAPSSPRSQRPMSKAYTNDEGDFDDSASIADSAISTRVYRSESDRIKYFKNQPECGKIEPHMVECLRCTKFLSLGRKQTYAVRPWEKHRAKCDQLPAVVAPSAAAPSKDTSVKAPLSRSNSLVDPSPARRLTEEERKAALESDKQIETLEPDRALCRKCQDWVQLSDKHAYIAGSWMKHKIQCSDALPSNRVVTAKRKLLLVNDSQVKSFDAKQVECSHCNAHVELKGEGDYNIASWEEHKSACKRRGSTSNGVNSIPFPSGSARPPPSTGSTNTEQTLIASDPHAPDSPNALKRSRDEPDAPSEEERPANRPRSDSYIPPQKEEVPGALGWLLLPFHAFARGFRESLKNGTSS